MTFGSVEFLAFLLLAWLVHRLAPDRLRAAALLLLSYGFYAALGAPHLLLALALVTGVSYLGGRALGAARTDLRRDWILRACLAACLAALLLVRYLLPRAASDPASSLPASLLVVTGVSYFTFQAISYLADVHLGVAEPEPDLTRHALALAFFPKLLQGPIERAGDLLPQLRRPFTFDPVAARSGLLLLGLGLFKKAVLADRLALWPDAVYGDVHAWSGAPLVLATLGYAFQLYFDFSGYTDMARGSARLLGIELTENFRSPYLATSISDFWRRWHVSFSRWILDYLFRPLQLAWRDLGRWGTALALVATFLVSGLWHGATWGFVAWGLLHGLYLAASTIYRPHQKRLHQRLGVTGAAWLPAWQAAVTFTLVCVAWVFFRARSLGDAWYVLTHAGPGAGQLRAFALLEGKRYLASTLALLAAYPLVLRPALARAIDGERPRLRWAVYYGCATAILVFGVFGKGAFIYGRF